MAEVACNENLTMEACLTGCGNAWEAAQGIGEDCGAVFELLNTCLAGLDCDGWAEYSNHGDPPYACSDADVAFKDAC